MNKNFRKLILPLSILAASQSHALGLGGLQVNSALDETLEGKIPLVLDGNEEIENLTVSLASSSEYQKVGLDKTYVPSNIKVNLVENNGQKYIEITSRGPVSEPIVSLLLVVDWSNGHLLREYTLLLDPPLFNSRQVQENYSEPVQTQTYNAPEQINDSSQTESIQSNYTSQVNNTAPNQVVVESGDTLWEIAERYNSGSATAQQMMVAIFDGNPSAFQNNDMNLIKKGAILDMPSSEQVALISNNEAISEVRTQTQKWSTLQTSSESNQNAATSQRDYGIELVPPNDADSANNNSTGGSNASDSRNRARVNQLQEDLVSSNLENEELNNRIKELERIVSDQKAALSLKDTNLAQLQQQLSENVTTDDVWDSADVMSSDDSTGDSMADDTMTSDSMADDTMSSDSMADDTMSSDSMTDDTMSSDSMVDDEQASDAIDESTQVNNAVQAPVKPQERSFMDKIMNYKYEALIGFGALLLAILGFVFYKRKDQMEVEDEGGFLDSISNRPDKNDETTETRENAALDDTILNNEATDLDLTNLDDIDLSDDKNEEEINLENQSDDDSQPEVIMMDEQQDDSFELDIDEFDLDGQEFVDTIEDLSLEENITEEVVSDFVDDTAAEVFDMDEKVPTLDDDNSEEMFDLDLDDLLADEEALDSSENQPEIEKEIENFEESIDGALEENNDFTLDFDIDELDELDDLEEESVGVIDEELSLDLDLGVDEAHLENEVEDDASLEGLEFNTDELLTMSDEQDSDEGVDLNLDFGEDFDLDLSMNDDMNTENEEDIDIGLDFDDLVSDDAIDTKLDLAKAYFEMGDIDGAKQMVVEIIEEGNDDQKAKAESLKNEIESS